MNIILNIILNIISTLNRVLLGSENIDPTSGMENADLSGKLRKSLETIDNITSIEEARQESAVNYGGNHKKTSVKETARVESTGSTNRETPVEKRKTKIPTERKIIGKSSNSTGHTDRALSMIA